MNRWRLRVTSKNLLGCVLVAVIVAFPAQSLAGKTTTKNTSDRLVLAAIQPVECTAEVAGLFSISSLERGVMARGSAKVIREGKVISAWATFGLTIGGDIEFNSTGPPEMGFTTDTMSGMQLWLPGATHALSGRVANHGKAGWVFIGDHEYPLHFKVVRGRGYVYLCGRGSVREPDGKMHRLGEGQTRHKWHKVLNSADPLARESAARALAVMGDAESMARLREALVSEKQQAVKVAIEDALNALLEKQQTVR